MTRCWEEEPQSRPSFTSLVSSVGNLLPDDYTKVSHLHFFSVSSRITTKTRTTTLSDYWLFVSQRYELLAENFQTSHKSVGRPTEGQCLGTGSLTASSSTSSTDRPHPPWPSQEVPPLRQRQTRWRWSQGRQAPPRALTSSPSVTSP